MNAVVACVLVLDGWAAADETLRSIKCHGLTAVVGLIGEESGKRPNDVTVHRVDWHDHFADARNQLADRLCADWLLWLNDDETLDSFDTPPLQSLRAGVWINDGDEMTPRLSLRLQRGRCDIRWSGALYETLVSDDPGPIEIVDGIVIRVNATRRRDRLNHHHQMALRGGLSGYEHALAEARHATFMDQSSDDFMHWLRAYKLSAPLPDHPVHPDPRVEPAIQLCRYDFIKPALLLADENPGILELDFAIIRSMLDTKRQRFGSRGNNLVRRLVDGRFDRRYSIRQGWEDRRPRHVRHVLQACLIGDDDRSRMIEHPDNALRVGRYCIVSAWNTSAAQPGRYGFTIDAGLVFGTGRHPATKGALAAFDQLARRRRFRHVLDFGCGSGILAIAAAKTWSGRVSALDINPVMVEQTRRNIQANALGGRVRARVIYGLRYARLPRGVSYDLEVINLQAKYIIRYGKALRRHLAPGGVMVLTGFSFEDEKRIFSYYRALGLLMKTVIRSSTWSTMILELPNTTTRPTA